MTDYIIREVDNKKDFKKFISLPDRLYRNTPQYVPNLKSDEKKIFTKSPCLEYCKMKMWIVLKVDKCVGRICGIINPKYNEIYKTKRARFGWIEFEKDIEIARLLINKAQEWAKSEGMNEIHGPLGYNTWYKQGMLIEGFDNIPPTNCIYNFSYYPEFIQKLGFEKEIDWVQYKLSANQGSTERLDRLSKILLEKYPLKVINVNKLKKQSSVAELFFKNYNKTFRSVYNFVPLSRDEVEVLGKHYISLLRPELNCFVMDDEEIIAAYGVCMPFMSKAFQKTKGHLFPFGWISLLHEFRHYDTIDLMMVGVDPKWKSRGVSSIFHSYLAHSFQKNKIKYAITNPQIENNPAVKVWDSYKNKELYMRRRCFIKKI
ncbi:MAG: hypothetical protein WC140_05780 [Bacteroidales bacterium]